MGGNEQQDLEDDLSESLARITELEQDIEAAKRGPYCTSCGNELGCEECLILMPQADAHEIKVKNARLREALDYTRRHLDAVLREVDVALTPKEGG
jgi:hypothetical protein